MIHSKCIYSKEAKCYEEAKTTYRGFDIVGVAYHPMLCKRRRWRGAEDRQLTDEEQWEQMIKQAPAMAAYEQLITDWINTDGQLVYPDAFGGFYHTDDFKLAVKVVNGDERFISEISEIVEDSSVLAFENTDISFNELMTLSEEVTETLSGLGLSCGINQLDSVVNVSISETDVKSRKSKAALSKIAQLDHVVITIDSVAVAQAISYNPGKLIYNGQSYLSASEGIGTLGFYGSYTFADRITRPCFVTAGHVLNAFRQDNSNMYFGNSQIFNKSYYGDGRYCYSVCGSRINANGLPEGTGLGDYALMACGDAVPGSTGINRSNSIQIGNSVTVTVTSYFGESIVSKLQSGATSPTDESEIAKLCQDANLYNVPLPQRTQVAKGLGVGNGTSTFGYVNTVCYTASVDADSSGQNQYSISGAMVIIPANGTGTYFSQPGDSGAPVYYTSQAGTITLLGIINAGTNTATLTPATNCRSIITPTTVLVSKGFIPYVG